MAIRKRHLGIPNESRDSFAILVREGIIAPDLGDRLKRMVGFRNLAVHQYRELDLDILDAVIRKNLDELLTFPVIHDRSFVRFIALRYPTPKFRNIFWKIPMGSEADIVHDPKV